MSFSPSSPPTTTIFGESLIQGEHPVLPVLKKQSSKQRFLFRVVGLPIGIILFPIVGIILSLRSIKNTLFKKQALNKNVAEVFSGLAMDEARPITIQPSRTALLMSIVRHAGFLAGLTENTYDSLFLPTFPYVGAIAMGYLHRLAPSIVGGWMVGSLSSIALRTMFFDRVVINAKISQVVFLGSGFCTRAHRVHDKVQPGTRFFEVDAATTQTSKRAIIDKQLDDGVKYFTNHGIEYVSVDFSKEKPIQRLVQYGFDTSKPAVFIVEGVSMYLSEASVKQMLTDISQSCSRGTLVGIDFLEDVWSADDEELIHKRFAADALVNVLKKKTKGETLQFGFKHQQLLQDFVKPLGFSVEVHLTPFECTRRFMIDPLTKQEYEQISDLEHFIVLRVI
jgi:methyltransferase (TIGR00027 family)